MDDSRITPSLLGFVTCVPNERMETDEFWERVGHALVGLVPLRIWELRDASELEIGVLAKECSALIASGADAFMFQKQQQKPTGVLAALATAFAVLARVEGGITHLGVHACLEPHAGCPRE
ncbi:hypothetical protein [Actinacidiphila sp. ITFR-21]|uniref:hypothetical protein n=1 Tax=Actinacidiphila sp. ITFR-21 TaxID=3075199 RepID=UPI00288AC069|nr:hypothetical protein [Streptomyces sp. ITFR-21]WNI17559.1 hypothetical protein RLT57_19915 [Streptomyces sp. ITFR-21]WNI17699.1 hypothetical protein RLT57_20630 [Streptomyces sp. ITFR-21]